MKKIKITALFLIMALTFNVGVFAIDARQISELSHGECSHKGHDQSYYYQCLADIFGVDKDGNILLPDSQAEFMAILEKNNIAYELDKEGNISLTFSHEVGGTRNCPHPLGATIYSYHSYTLGPDMYTCSTTVNQTYYICSACKSCYRCDEKTVTLYHSFTIISLGVYRCIYCNYIRSYSF